MNWISQKPALTNIRRSVASSKTSFVSPWASEEPESDDENDFSEEAMLRFENDLQDFWRAALEKNIRDVCVNQGLKDGPSQQWFSLPSKKTRPLSTVVIEPEIKSNLLRDIEGFFHPHTRYWYHTRGIPYRRGYLFHGPPGTGKSSLCLAMASLIDLDIYTVSLNSKTMNGDSLTRLFLSLPKQCLVLFEDVDQAGIKKHSIGGTSLQSDEVTDTDNRASDSPESSEHLAYLLKKAVF
ncbi:hypothetical protein AOCH_007636 [Aspergillus ochraceoroseus]|uniref:AAA+ ATPase domain-containing protein n=1 Tax=Aspergillus ochraceoroseus TaxID=138278 RepID=A0A0F8UXS1_9EURO|nr:hypothetical protein AOCH_007636 [Aspergillus ochraceoroseus]